MAAVEVRRNPSRSAKRAEPQPGVSDEFFDPDAKNPTSKVDRQLRILNLQAYPTNIFGWVDDLIMFGAFSKKGGKRRHHAVIPERSKGSNSALPPAEVGKKVAEICKPIFSGREASWDAVCEVASLLQKGIPYFHPETPELGKCLPQCVMPWRGWLCC
jgi:hypothetical protein